MVAMAHKDKDLVNFILSRGGWINVHLFDEAVELALELDEWELWGKLLANL